MDRGLICCVGHGWKGWKGERMIAKRARTWIFAVHCSHLRL